VCAEERRWCLASISTACLRRTALDKRQRGEEGIVTLPLPSGRGIGGGKFLKGAQAALFIPGGERKEEGKGWYGAPSGGGGGGGVQLGDKGTTPGHGGRRRAVWQRREADMNWGAGLADRWGPATV
jgi:hypothetical protein